MPPENTAILLTPPGAAAIAVVRLAGPGVGAFLARHFSRPTPVNRCVHGELRDERGDVLDDPVVVCPAGLPFADLSVHGGPWVVQSVLNLAERAGFPRVESLGAVAAAAPRRHSESSCGFAAPTRDETRAVDGCHGQGFTLARGLCVTERPRASENACPWHPGLTVTPVGMTSPDGASFLEAHDELEREVLNALPLARTELALRTLLAQSEAWAELEARVRASAGGVREELLASCADRSLVHLLSPPRVAIVGAPNVGKSTLANQLFAQERSITADLPGTTRDWVGEFANVDGLAVMLVDTPGFRETPDALEREAIVRGRAEAGRADLAVLVLDPTQPAEPEQRALLRAFPDALRVMNKADRAAAWSAEGLGHLRTVATTGAGVDLLRQAILKRFGCLNLIPNRPRIWTERQASVVQRWLSDPDFLPTM